MRLLNVNTLVLKEYLSDETLPPYAILSHTWGDEEVTLSELTTLPREEIRKKSGFDKIQDCCRQAFKDSYEWVWIDTCCIDKTSSAELSEAINSMFRWYQQANVCYAYLSDVYNSIYPSELQARIAASRWFTRGWTLQELIAPCEVKFFDRNWGLIDTRANMAVVISSITGIDDTYLRRETDLESASVAQRMSWASHRETSRPEDMAYCLLGIFDVNIPLIYGEGKRKAFHRLQENIIKMRPYDHTLFAWGKVHLMPGPESEPFVEETPLELRSVLMSESVDGIPWSYELSRQPLMGLLAGSPADFASSGHFRVAWNARRYMWTDERHAVPTLMGDEVRVELPVMAKKPPSCFPYHYSNPAIVQLRPSGLAALLCYHDKYPDCVVLIALKGWDENSWGRTWYLIISQDPSARSLIQNPFQPRAVFYIGPERLINHQSGDILFRRPMPTSDPQSLQPSVTMLFNALVLRAPSRVAGTLQYFCLARDGRPQWENRAWYLMVWRTKMNRNGSVGNLWLYAVRVSLSGKEETDAQSRTWYPKARLLTDRSIAFRGHEVKTPKDTWVLEDSGDMPIVRIEVERLRIDNSGRDTVDVMDVQVKTARTI